MGGGPLCVENNDKHVEALLDLYYELGGNFIDSANIYGKWLPSETNLCDINIGKWMRSRNLRNKIIVTSKGGHPPLTDMYNPLLSKEDVEEHLDESLTALGVDCIDLYYLHRDDPKVPVEYIIDYLCEFVGKGKIRYFAVSNWAPVRIQAAQAYAEATGKQGFAANQIMWSYAAADMSKSPLPLLVNMDDESFRYHMESGMSAILYESQAQGFFQKYANREKAPVAENLMSLYGSNANFQRYERLLSLSSQLNVNITEIVLGYVLNQPFSTYAIIGSSNKDHIRESMTAANLCLSREQIEYLSG